MVIMTKQEVSIGSHKIGLNHKLALQVMLKCKTSNISEVIEQIKICKQYGIDIVRVSIFDTLDAISLKEIKKAIDINLIADIHYDYKLALLAIESGADKIRLNPSNITNEPDLLQIVHSCKEKHIPIRIGINGGSLLNGKKLLTKDLINLLDKEINIFKRYEFEDIVISVKVNDYNEAIKINKKINKLYPYPIHLGVTEAGGTIDSIIKSSIFTSEMIKHNIGSTIRFSTYGTLLDEIFVGKRILINLGILPGVKLIVCPTCGRLQFNFSKIYPKIEAIAYSSKKNLTVALMGCSVNGPGEAQNADIAIVGSLNKAAFYLKGKKVKVVEEGDILATFIEYFNQFV